MLTKDSRLNVQYTNHGMDTALLLCTGVKRHRHTENTQTEEVVNKRKELLLRLMKFNLKKILESYEKLSEAN